MFCVVCLSFSFSACSLLISKLKVETKDMNGEDDHSLVVFNEEDICAENNDCYCTLYTVVPTGNYSYEGQKLLQDGDSIEAIARSPLSGVALLQATYGKEDTIVFTVECNRTKGNLRIVLLDEELNIIHDFDINGTSQFTVNNAKGKEFEIRVAGESAEFVINVSREFSTPEDSSKALSVD